MNENSPRTGSLKRNLIANLLGSNFAALLQVALMPLYLKLLGAEPFGLIGIFTMFQALIAFLDAGVSGALSRELAEPAASAESRAWQGDLVRTAEALYFVVGAVIIVAVIALAPTFASDWLRVSSVSHDEATRAIMLIGGVLGAQWPSSVYNATLYGLRRHVPVNVVAGVIAILRWGGAAVVLVTVAPTIEAYFAWQIAVSVLQTVLLAGAMRRALADAGIPLGRVRPIGMARPLKLAGGLTLIAILSAFTMQLDKIVLSRALPLAQFGYYALAASAASLLYRLAYPIQLSFSPEIARLTFVNDEGSLARTFHSAAQLIAIAIVPLGGVILVFAPELLQLWTHNTAVAASAGLPLRLLVASAMLLAMMYPNWGLQVALRWTAPAIAANVVALAAAALFMPPLARAYGGTGTAAVWLGIIVIEVLALPQVVHHRILPEEKWRWYWLDLLLPLAGILIPLAGFRLLLPAMSGAPQTVGAIVAAAALALALALALLPRGRFLVAFAYKRFHDETTKFRQLDGHSADRTSKNSSPLIRDKQ